MVNCNTILCFLSYCKILVRAWIMAWTGIILDLLNVFFRMYPKQRRIHLLLEQINWFLSKNFFQKKWRNMCLMRERMNILKIDILKNAFFPERMNLSLADFHNLSFSLFSAGNDSALSCDRRVTNPHQLGINI